MRPVPGRTMLLAWRGGAVGIQPYRAPSPAAVDPPARRSAVVIDALGRFYFKPEAGGGSGLAPMTRRPAIPAIAGRRNMTSRSQSTGWSRWWTGGWSGWSIAGRGFEASRPTGCRSMASLREQGLSSGARGRGLRDPDRAGGGEARRVPASRPCSDAMVAAIDPRPIWRSGSRTEARRRRRACPPAHSPGGRHVP
jgi:hypothetical protein